MKPNVTFFPVGNGDMTLIQLETGRCILIDINIRQPDEDGEIRDVVADLEGQAAQGQAGTTLRRTPCCSPHPDQDHCRGLKEHFHLGPLADYARAERETRTAKSSSAKCGLRPWCFGGAPRATHSAKTLTPGPQKHGGGSNCTRRAVEPR